MTKKWLFWLPRILGIVFPIFISTFALDVFGAGYLWYEVIMALLVHLVPTYIAVAILLIAWKWPQIGSLFYFAAGLFYFLMVWQIENWIAILLITGPLFLTGAQIGRASCRERV